MLGKGSRCLLIGANGCQWLELRPSNLLEADPERSLFAAGKSTLLRILAGKKLTKTKTAKILGQDVFMNPPGVSCLSR